MLIIKHKLIYRLVIEAFQKLYKRLKINHLCKINLFLYFKLSYVWCTNYKDT